MVRNIVLVFDIFFFKFNFPIFYTNSLIFPCLENDEGIDNPLIMCSEYASNAFVIITLQPQSVGNTSPLPFTGYNFHSTWDTLKVTIRTIKLDGIQPTFIVHMFVQGVEIQGSLIHNRDFQRGTLQFPEFSNFVQKVELNSSLCLD